MSIQQQEREKGNMISKQHWGRNQEWFPSWKKKEESNMKKKRRDKRRGREKI